MGSISGTLATDVRAARRALWSLYTPYAWSEVEVKPVNYSSRLSRGSRSAGRQPTGLLVSKYFMSVNFSGARVDIPGLATKRSWKWARRLSRSPSRKAGCSTRFPFSLWPSGNFLEWPTLVFTRYGGDTTRALQGHVGEGERVDVEGCWKVCPYWDKYRILNVVGRKRGWRIITGSNPETKVDSIRRQRRGVFKSFIRWVKKRAPELAAEVFYLNVGLRLCCDRLKILQVIGM